MADKHEINETFKTANSLIYDFEKEARGDRECKRDIIGSKYSIPLNMISAKLKFLYYNHNGFSVYNANAYARLYNIVFDKNISILGNDLFTINFSRIDSFANEYFSKYCRKECECTPGREYLKVDVLLSKNFEFSKECIDNMIEYINYIRHFECMCTNYLKLLLMLMIIVVWRYFPNLI